MELKVFDLLGYEDFFLNNPGFKWFEVSGLSNKPSAVDLDKLKKHLDVIELPEKLAELYDYTESARLGYAYEMPNGIVSYGNYHLTSIEDMISGNPFAERSEQEDYLKGILWDDKDDEGHISLMQKFIVIDYINMVSDTYTLAKVNQRASSLYLYLYIYPGIIYPLEIDIIQYVELSDQLRGVMGWQMLFIDERKLSSDEINQLHKYRKSNIRKNVEEIFGDADIDLLPSKEYWCEPPFIEDSAETNLNYFIDKKIEDLDSTIGDNGYLKLETEWATIPRPLEVHSVNKAESILGKKLPDEIIGFYIQYNGFSIDWSNEDCVDENGYHPGADFEIVPFHQIFGGRNFSEDRRWGPGKFEGSVVMKDLMDIETFEIAQECFPVLFSESFSVVVRFLDDQEYELYGVIDHQYQLLSSSFSELINMVISLMGLEYWFLLLPEYQELNQGDVIYPDIKYFVEEMFPEFAI